MKKFTKFFNWKVRSILLGSLFIVLIGFTEISQNGLVCKSVKVEISEDTDNHFLDELDVINIATAQGERFFEGEPIESIDLKLVEKELENNPYISAAEIFKDLDGNLLISVTLRRPVARIVRKNYPGAYLTFDGFLMPISEKFVSRTMIITGPGTEKMMKPGYFADEEGEKMLELVNYIHTDELWKAQIAEMEVLNSGKVQFLPQVTRQKIEFGKPEDIEKKFNKLKVFYTSVLPVKGWNTYSRVNLEFDNQIIAE